MPFHFSLMSEEESYDEPYEEEPYESTEEEDQYIDKASNERFKEINKNIVQLYDKSLAIFAKFQYDKLENHLLD